MLILVIGSARLRGISSGCALMDEIAVASIATCNGGSSNVRIAISRKKGVTIVCKIKALYSAKVSTVCSSWVHL